MNDTGKSLPNRTGKSLPNGTDGVLIPDLAWTEMVEWVRARVAASEGQFSGETLWYRGRFDPVVVIAALSQIVEGLCAGIFAADVTNRPALLAAKQIMTVNALCDGRLQILIDDAHSFREVHEQLERVAAADATVPPRLLDVI